MPESEAIARLPASWKVARVWDDTVSIGTGEGALGVRLTVADTTNPLIIGTYGIVEGRLPDKPGEVAVERTLAQATGAGVGADLVFRSQHEGERGGPWSMTVVGVVRAAEEFFPRHHAGDDTEPGPG